MSKKRAAPGRVTPDPTVTVKLDVCARFHEWDRSIVTMRYPVKQADMEAWEGRGRVGEPPEGDAMPEDVQPCVGLLLLRVLRNHQAKHDKAAFRIQRIGEAISDALEAGKAYTCRMVELGTIQDALKAYVKAENSQGRPDNLIYPQLMAAVKIDPFEDEKDED